MSEAQITVSMILFMPWCPIDKVYQVGDVTLLPFERQKPIIGLDQAELTQVRALMGIYKDIEGEPVNRAALIRFGHKSVIEDLNEAEIDEAYDLVAIACFCGLTNRQYFNSLGPYCNSDSFSLFVQRFKDTEFVALTSRRRDGSNMSAWAVEEIAITIPIHAHTIRSISLDERLLGALIVHRGLAGSEWGRWQSAISCFNWANTDSDNIRHQVEWVNLCGAFEHLLEAKTMAEDVARRFSDVLTPSDPLLARDANCRSTKSADKGQSLRYEWMREFYRIRGDFAHGRLSSQQATVWEPFEYLVLATIAFPLVVKGLLDKAHRHDLSDADRDQIDAFERFSDTKDFTNPPLDQKNSLDSHWKRLVEDRRWKRTTREIAEKLKAHRQMASGENGHPRDRGEVDNEDK
ncbi:MAG: hypothetical protein AB1512_30330 [Thermodesulfobacteriota bacterium]